MFAAPEASAFSFSIDTPRSGEVPTPSLWIRGWCFRKDGRPLTGVRARLGERCLAGAIGLPRPDVMQAFGSGAPSDTGFEVHLRLFRGLNTIRLEACDEEGQWREFTRLELRPLQDSVLDSPFGRLAFWARAWLGRPGAFLSLQPSDREYILAHLRAEGLVGLGVLQQHEPIPVVLERFPVLRTLPSERPSLTIVTPSYNQADYLLETTLSVLRQPGVSVDYLIQDGGSRDGSADIIERLALEHGNTHPTRISHWESKPDKGQSDAIVKGFSHSTGQPDDVMAYLNSDDVYMPGVLPFVADYFARHPEVDAVYGHRVMIDENSDEIGRWYCPRQACDNLALMDLIPQETLFWRRRLWDKVGGIDPSFQFAMDWDLLLRFQLAGAKIVRLPYFMALFRVHSQQKTQAWMGEHGTREMERLRARSLDRVPAPEEIHIAMALAQFDSALVHRLHRRGIRV